MAEKARRLPPVTHDDKDGAQRQKLTYLDPDIEGNQVDEQAIGGNFELLDFGRQAKAVEETKDKRRHLRIRLKAKPALERAKVIEGFVDHRQSDNGINEISAYADVKERPNEQRCGVSDSKQADEQPDIAHFVEKENHAEQKQQVIVAGHHMLRAKVDKRDDVNPGDFLDVPFVAFGYAMCGRTLAVEKQ